MATNRVFADGDELSLTVSHPTTPSSGDPCRLGGITAVATTDERDDGTTSVQLDGVWDLSVKGVNDSGNSAVAAGDPVFYVDSDVNDGTGFLSKKTSGYFFGFALEAVTSGATSTIRVLQVPGPGSGTADVLASAIGTSELADDSVTKAKLAGGFLKGKVVAGGAAGNITVTGIATADELVLVARLDRDATAANVNLTDLTSEFTITAADTINNTSGTNTTGDALLVLYIDLT